MALDTFIAGRYSGAYATQDVGITSQGFEVQNDFELEDIGESDAYGLTVIDAIFRGGQCHIQFESLAYKVGSLACFWPWGGALGANGVLGYLYDSGAATPAVIGVLASAAARTLVLTATAGTPAAAMPASLTGTNNTLLAKNNNGRLLFNSKLRTVPVRMRMYPFTSGNTLRFFTTA